MRPTPPQIAQLCLAIIAAGAFVREARGETGHQRVQEIALSAGWNAVYLAVQPVESAPEKVFAGLPVDTGGHLVRETRSPTSS